MILFDGYYDAEHGRTSGCENDPGHGEGTTGRKFDSDYCLVRKCVCGGCQASVDSGMNGHISKPFDMEEVTATIAKYVKP